MRGRENTAIASYLDWWSAAGLIDPVQDEPYGWLQPAAPANDVMPSPSVSLSPQTVQRTASQTDSATALAPALPKEDLPQDLAAFDAWLSSHPTLPGALWSPRRIMPSGPAGASIMVVADMPDPEDLITGHLLSGDVGALFDAMMTAIGFGRADLRLCSIALTRPAGGRWDEASAAALSEIMLHHIMIARPQRLLLLGQMTCRLLTGEDVPADGMGLRNINHYGVTTAVTAIHHPRLLLHRHALKRGAWTALKSLREPA